MEYKIETWEAMDLLAHANDFRAETSDQDIPAFWDEYYAKILHVKTRIDHL